MCIAIASPIGTPIPSKAYLKECFKNNSDGAGIAFNNDGVVKIYKGFMSFENFYQVLRSLDTEYHLEDRGVLLHCRITTHGGTCKEMTHPFPISRKENKLKKKRCVANYAIVHNGIIDLTSTEAKKRNKMSDTAVFVQEYLSLIASNPGWFNNEKNIKLIEELIGSKMAILDGEGNIKMTSGFTKDEDGNYYSNSTYKESRYKSYYSSYYSAPCASPTKYSKYDSPYDKYYNEYYDEYDYGYNGWGHYDERAKKPSTTNEHTTTTSTSVTQLMKIDANMYFSSPECAFDYSDTLSTSQEFFVDEDGNLYSGYTSGTTDGNRIIYLEKEYIVGELRNAETDARISFEPTHKIATHKIWSR